MSTTTVALLEPFLNDSVIISTVDGKVLIGKLTGFDQACNLVLSRCTERIFSASEGVQTQEHGLLLVRGDNVGVIGEIDTDVDTALDYSVVKAAPLKSIRH